MLFILLSSIAYAIVYETKSQSLTQTIVRRWLSGWDKRVKITIDHNDVDSDLTNFPVLIYLSNSSGRNNDDVTFVFNELISDANRKKIAVTTSDKTTQCYVEIEKWDASNEKAWLWVKVPSISSTADTDLYLYYDKDHADNPDYVGDTGSTPAQNVWDSNYKGVYHLQGDPTTPTSTNWGKTDIGSSSTTSSHSRAIGGTSPNVDNLKIESISIYLGAQTGNVRLAVYSGGQLDNPTSAILLWDAGTVNPNGVAGWYTVNNPSDGVSWPKNTVTWLAWKRNTGVAVYYHSSSSQAGDFQTLRGRNNNGFNQDPSVAFPSTYGEQGTFSNAWYSMYVNYEVEISDPLKDSTSNQNNPTSSGSMTSGDQVTGKIDGSVDFDGADDFISMPNSESLQFTNSLTIEAWIRVNSFGSGSDVDIILRKGEGNPNDYQLAVNDQKLALMIEENDGGGLNSSASLSTLTWYYVVGTWDGATRKVYIDGLENGSGSKSGSIVPDSRAIYVGGRSGTDLSNGIIDEVRASDTSRNEAWIKASYESGRDHLLGFGSEEIA